MDIDDYIISIHIIVLELDERRFRSFFIFRNTIVHFVDHQIINLLTKNYTVQKIKKLFHNNNILGMIRFYLMQIKLISYLVKLNVLFLYNSF